MDKGIGVSWRGHGSVGCQCCYSGISLSNLTDKVDPIQICFVIKINGQLDPQQLLGLCLLGFRDFLFVVWQCEVLLSYGHLS